uniref:C2H2-type domain-containing protein n=1 Tax=Anopheles farauti TaxID=69004 RepID=A0A182QL69_9DIPT
MDIFQNQCSESLGFDSMLSSNHLNSPLHDSPESPNPLTFAPASPYFASISQQSQSVSCGHQHTSGPNDVILPSIFVKIPTQINQQYQQENRLRVHHNTANEIKCEERTESIKSEVADTRGIKLPNVNSNDRLPDVIGNYLNDPEPLVQQEKPILMCEFCPFASLCETRMSDHRRERHPVGVTESLTEKWDCPVCENKFFKRVVFELHLAEDHQMLRGEVEALHDRVVNSGGRQTETIPATRTTETMGNNNPARNKSRIYIKNVQLLKKPDYNTTSSTSSYHLSNSSSPTLIDTMNNVYSTTVQPEPVATTQPKGSRIYIKNVDILRNPMISLDESTSTASPVASFNDTITSRASSCESIICTSTPPAATEQQMIVPPNTDGYVALSQVEIISPPKLAPPPGSGDPSTATYTVGPPMDDTSNLLMLFSAPLEANGAGEPSVSYMHEYDEQQGQQPQQRKSKIFIKNISVLKQPTIHLKSVDEVNLMTYDELQLQNMLPVAVSQSASDAMGSSSALEQRVVDADAVAQLEKPFGGKMMDEVEEIHTSQEDVMDGYHESDLAYGDLGEVCDFGDSFNERDDPGGGSGDGTEEVALTRTSTGSDGDLLGDSLHCESITTSGFSNDLILLQDESNGNGKIWLETGGATTTLGSEVLTLETHQDLAGSLRRDEDLMLDDSQHVINIDPPNANSDIQPTAEQSTPLVDTFTPHEAAASQPSDGNPNTTRARGRPKGAKQTGITKLKKLYTNLTAEEEGYKCDQKECGVRFRQPDRLDYHRRCHVPGETATIHCPECGSQEFRNWNTLHTHLWREHTIDMELYACHLCSFKTPCGVKFAGKRQLRTHMDAKHPTDTGEDQGTGSTASTASTSHSTTTTASKHRCLLCGMMFRTRYLLQSHAAKHSDEKRFKCEHCDYTTNDHNAFRRHKMRHSAKGAHRYKCSYCDYSSIQSTTYRKHLERMHADVASTLLYKCAHCPFVSISELKYQLHRAKHEAEEAAGQPTIESDPGRQCESVNSDVIIVEQQQHEQQLQQQHHQQQQQQEHQQQPQEHPGVSTLDVQPLEEAGYPQQHPIIRPAMSSYYVYNRTVLSAPDENTHGCVGWNTQSNTEKSFTMP